MVKTSLHARGFTLIEIAIALFLIGLVMSGVIALMTSLATSSRDKATRDRLAVIQVQLQSYVARTGRLPCPADPGAGSGSATFGLEAPTPGTCTGATALGTTGFFGTLPWKTIAIGTDVAVDGWQNQFSYAVTGTATVGNLSSLTLSSLSGSLTLHSDAPIALGLPATGNQLNACSATANDNTCNSFASVIVISHGPNGLGARTWSGGAPGAPTSNRELANIGSGTAFVNADYSTVDANHFDDVVIALAPAGLLAPLIAQGSIKSEYTILAETFRRLAAILASTTVKNRTGTVSGAYTYTLPSSLSTFGYTSFNNARFSTDCTSNPPISIGTGPSELQLLDPWGTPIRYQRAETGIVSGEPCPTYAVFVSAGPDKSFVSTADDIVYYVSKGEMDQIIGLVGW